MAKKKTTADPDTGDKGPVVVKWGISTGVASVGGEWEIDRSEWDGMTPADREKMLDEYMNDEMGNHVDMWYEIPEGEK